MNEEIFTDAYETLNNISLKYSNKILTHKRSDKLEKYDVIDKFLIYFYLTYSNPDNYIYNLFDLYIEKTKICNNILKNNNYVLIIPGDSPSLFWYAMNLIYKSTKNIKSLVFPISGIIHYEENYKEYNEHLLKIFKEKIISLEEKIFDPEYYEEFINKLEYYHGLKKEIDNTDRIINNNYKILDSYMKKILENINKDENFLYIDFIHRSNLYNELKLCFKRLEYTGEIQKFNIEDADSAKNNRCTMKLRLEDIEKDIYHEIQHNYFRCNILLFIFDQFIKDKELIINKILNLKTKFKYNYKKLKQFENKMINIIYLNPVFEIVDDYEQFKIITLKNVKCGQVYDMYINIQNYEKITFRIINFNCIFNIELA